MASIHHQLLVAAVCLSLSLGFSGSSLLADPPFQSQFERRVVGDLPLKGSINFNYVPGSHQQVIEEPDHKEPEQLDDAVKEVKWMHQSGRTPAEIAQWMSEMLDRRISNANWGGADYSPLSDEQHKAWEDFGFRDGMTYQEIAQEAWKHGVGQCAEHTYTAYHILKQAGIQTRIVESTKGKSTHAYLVWGAPPGTSTDPRAWTKDTVSVDGWLGKSLHKDEAWKNRYYNENGTRNPIDRTENYDPSAAPQKKETRVITPEF